MSNIEKKNFNSPDETSNPGEKLKSEMITVGGKTIYKQTAQPGWKWSEHLKPVVKTDTCQRNHFIYTLSGRLASQMTGAEVVELGPGDIGSIPPGHDGWVLGDEPAVWLDIAQ